MGLDRLGDVRSLNVFLTGQISDRPGQLHALRAVVGPRAQLHLPHGGLDQAEGALRVLVLVSSSGQYCRISPGPIPREAAHCRHWLATIFR